MDNNETNESEWKLDSLRMDLNHYGENKGEYEGRIKFCNNQSEEFSFKLDNEQCKSYLILISADIAKSASEMASKLIESLPKQSDNG